MVRLDDRRSAPRRVLITGLSTYWGGRLAQALEQSDAVEAIVGVDNRDPTRELERTEFVRVGTQHALLRRIVEAAEIDTVVDSRLVVDSVTTSPRKAHENNVIGTMNILAACGGPESAVRKLVFKSSAHFYGTAQDRVQAHVLAELQHGLAGRVVVVEAGGLELAVVHAAPEAQLTDHLGRDPEPHAA